MLKQIKNFLIMTLSITIMAIGVYYFKFPNNFTFGGVTGAAVVFAKITPLSASMFSTIVNMLLLVVGFFFLGKDFAIKTTYATILLSVELLVLEKLDPLTHPLSNEPMLELIFAIALPAIASALLFYVGASSGGTDVIAMIVKKYAHVENIGMALFLTDLVMIIIACFVFDIKTALYSFVGLVVKSLKIFPYLYFRLYPSFFHKIIRKHIQTTKQSSPFIILRYKKKHNRTPPISFSL